MTETTINNNTERRFDEFSPKKLILLINKALSYLFSKWHIILSVGILLGIAYSGCLVKIKKGQIRKFPVCPVKSG
jgi:hypothetical protein